MSQKSAFKLARTMDSTARGIAYTSRGEGRPVVLVHGWCLNRTLWTYQEEALSQNHHVVSIDLPGFGESKGIAGPYTLGRLADELAYVLEEFDLHDVLVVGFAFGAAIAMTLAERSDERLKSVVLIGPPSAGHAPYDRMPRAMRRDWPDFAARSAQAICKQPQSEATLRWLGEMFGRTPLPVAIETAGVLGDFEPLPLAPGIHIPTLLVHGVQDDMVPISISEACAAAMPNATLVPVDGSGHLVVIDQPGRLTELISEFAAQ